MCQIHWHHCWHGAKPLEIVVPSMKNTTIVFLFAAKLRGGCPKLWDRLQLFHFFLKKHLSRADQHVQVMCKVMKNEIVYLL